MFNIVIKSLMYRKWSLVLTFATLVLSVFLLILVSRVNESSRLSFTRVISSTDLIVGPRTTPLNLLMYSALGIGQATHSVSNKSFNYIRSLDEVESVVPMAIGDSFGGFPVIATTNEFLKRDLIDLKSGTITLENYKVVLGAEVSRKNNLDINSLMNIDHGGGHSFESHDNHPFKVSGILKPTNSPIDRFVFVGLKDFSELHSLEADQYSDHSHDEHHQHGVKPDDADINNKYNAFYVKLNNKNKIFNIKSKLDNYSEEALISIIPGQILLEFWANFKVFEAAIKFIAGALIIMSVLAILSQILSSLQMRTKEIALFKISGANNLFIILLIFVEVFFVTLLSVAFSYFLFALIEPLISKLFLQPLGLYLSISNITYAEFNYVVYIIMITSLTSFFTALYMISYSNKLSIRINRGL